MLSTYIYDTFAAMENIHLFLYNSTIDRHPAIKDCILDQFKTCCYIIVKTNPCANLMQLIAACEKALKFLIEHPGMNLPAVNYLIE
jgi:hypothetical protein